MQLDFLQRANALIQEIKNNKEQEFLLMDLNTQVLQNLIDEYEIIDIDLEMKQNVRQ
jgi:hypothetical protein